MNADLAGFETYLLTDGEERRPVTIERHLWNIRIVAQHVEVISKTEVDKFFAELKKQNRRNKYLNNFIGTLRLYARFKGIADGLESYKQRRNDSTRPTTLTEEEIEAFLSLPPARKQRVGLHEQMNLFWSIQFSCGGLRPGEVGHLRTCDIDFGLGALHIPQMYAKDKEARDVPIADSVKERLRSYINSLPPEQVFLFARNNKSGCINSDNWGEDFWKRIKRLGINRPNLVPYSTRHTWITLTADEGAPIEVVSNIAGHSDIRQTMHYYHDSLKKKKSVIDVSPLEMSNWDEYAIVEAFNRGLNDLVNRYKLNKNEKIKFNLEGTGEGVNFSIMVKKTPQ